MESSRQIIDFLQNLSNRALRQKIFHHVSFSILCGILLLVPVFIGIRLIKLPFSITIGTLILLCGAILIGLVLSFYKRKTLQYMAHYVDNDQDLKERVSTAHNLIQENREDEVALQQIQNTAESITDLDQQKVLPYSLPKSIKWFPIPLLIIGMSFAIPRQYSLPEPPSTQEQIAIEATYQNLENTLNSIKDPNLKNKINETISKLKNVKDVSSAQDHLRELNRIIQKQKSDLPDEVAITDATQDTQNFKGMDSNDLVNEIDKILNQQELTPALRADIKKILKNLSDNMPDNVLSSTFEQTQSEEISEETLQQFLNALKQLNELNNLEKQLTESRKEIALAGLELEESNGGVANTDSAAGNESGNTETQGTIVNSDSSDSSTSDSSEDTNVDDAELSDPLMGDQTSSIGTDGKELRLNSHSISDLHPSTRVYSGKKRNIVNESDYIPFTDVVLNAQRKYAQAIQTNRIPVRYRTQIKAYLEELNKINEQ
ncbi:hypothetical protein JT359_03740 [Candidatus Poribacteria bacterium]|nr:hypothetical protein [Candidatus Poribacteria bacterium]